MALLINASTPAAKHSADNLTAALVSNQFSPPAGSVIFVFWAGNDDPTGGQPAAPTITDSLGSHLNWQQTDWSRAADTSNVGNGQAAIWWAPCPSSQTNMTVTVTNGGTGGSALDAHIAPVVFTGADTTQNGAHGKGGGTSQTGTATYAATGAGSWGFLVFLDWAASSTHPTVQSGCTEDSWTTLATQSTGWIIRRTTADGALGNSVTVGASAPTVEGRFAYVEVLPTGNDTWTPWTPGFMLSVPGIPQFWRAQQPAGWTPLYPDTGISGPQTFQQPLSAGLSFTGTDTVRTSNNQSATLSFTGALTKRYATTLLAALSFVGAVSLRTGKLLATALSFTGAQSRAINSRQASSLSFTGTITRRTSKTTSAALSFTGALTRVVARLLTATLSFAGVLTSAVVHHYTQTLTATLSFTGSLTSAAVHHYTQALNATLSFTGSLIRNIGKTHVATLGFSGALSRRVSAFRTATLSFTGTQNRKVSSGLTAALSFAGTVFRRVTHGAFTAGLSFTGSMIAGRLFTKALSATVGFAGTLTRRVGKALTAALGFVGDLVVSLAQLRITPRPNTGTTGDFDLPHQQGGSSGRTFTMNSVGDMTSEPDTGITPRPDTGITPEP